MTTSQIVGLAIVAVIAAAAYAPLLGPLLNDAASRKRLLGLLRHAVVLAAVAYAISQFVRNPSRPAAPPVTAALQSASSTDRAAVASIYRSLADITERDGGRLITSTKAWRAIHADALRLAAGGTSLPGKYPGLDAAVEKVLAEHFTLDNLPLDKTLVEKIVAGCRAVESQCE